MRKITKSNGLTEVVNNISDLLIGSSPTTPSVVIPNLKSINTILEVVKEQERLKQSLMTPEVVEELASYGVSMKNIANLFRQDFRDVFADSELKYAFENGRAQVGAKVRASIVDDALEKDNFQAKVHLDKVFHREEFSPESVTSLQVNVQNNGLSEVSSADLIEIMLNKGDTN